MFPDKRGRWQVGWPWALGEQTDGDEREQRLLGEEQLWEVQQLGLLFVRT